MPRYGQGSFLPCYKGLKKGRRCGQQASTRGMNKPTNQLTKKISGTAAQTIGDTNRRLQWQAPWLFFLCVCLSLGVFSICLEYRSQAGWTQKKSFCNLDIAYLQKITEAGFLLPWKLRHKAIYLRFCKHIHTYVDLDITFFWPYSSYSLKIW